MVKVRNVSEGRRSRFVLRKRGEDAETVGLRLSEALLVVEQVVAAVVVVVVVEVEVARCGRRGRVVLAVVLVFVRFGIASGPEHIVLVELHGGVRCGRRRRRRLRRGARVFVRRVEKRSEKAFAGCGFTRSKPGRAVELHAGRPVGSWRKW